MMRASLPPIETLLLQPKVNTQSGLKAEIQTAIESGDSLLKFAYLGDGAKAWDRIRSHESFRTGDRELEALTLICHFIAPTLRENERINLIDVGSGNGVEIPLFLSAFQLSKKDSYTAVDLSHELLNKLAGRYFESLSREVNQVFFFQADAEAPGQIAEISQRVRSAHSGVNVMIAAGEGTLLSNSIVFKNISAALGPSDYALFSIDGCDPQEIQALCHQYDSEEVRSFLFHSIQCARKAGVVHQEGQFLPAEFDSAESMLRVYYQLSSGEKLLVLRSLKPCSEAGLEKRLREGGLIPIHIQRTSHSSFGVVCRRLGNEEGSTYDGKRKKKPR